MGVYTNNIKDLFVAVDRRVSGVMPSIAGFYLRI